MKPSYSAIVLDDRTKNNILNRVKYFFPKSWEVICHHITINFGSLKEEYGYNVGDKVKFDIIGVGKSDDALAVMVGGVKTKNEIPHITVAINSENGASPKDSNDIVKWNFFDKMPGYGIVEEIY